MRNLDFFEKLRSQSTWKLLGLGAITYGVYFAYYIKSRSKEINSVIDSEKAISSVFISCLFIVSYASLFLFIAYLFVEDGHPIEEISGLIDLIGTVMLVVWGFKARNRVNSYCDLDSETDTWFHGFWTFGFSPLYFNYKVNCILESDVEQVAPADS